MIQLKLRSLLLCILSCNWKDVYEVSFTVLYSANLRSIDFHAVLQLFL
jgi:hypothetical protein